MDDKGMVNWILEIADKDYPDEPHEVYLYWRDYGISGDIDDPSAAKIQAALAEMEMEFDNKHIFEDINNERVERLKNDESLMVLSARQIYNEEYSIAEDKDDFVYY